MDIYRFGEWEECCLDLNEGSSFLANIIENSNRHDGLFSLKTNFISAILYADLHVLREMNEIRKRLCHKNILVIVNELQQ